MKIIQKFNKLIICVMLLCMLLPTPTVEAGVSDFLADIAADLLGKAAELIPIEQWFANLFKGVANALNKMVAWAVGYQITIDDVVFNNYAPTKVDYFETLKKGEVSEIIWGKDGMPGLAATVNQCYGFFNKIAIMVYMVMLVYMGIRILLSSTGKSLSQYKTLFMYWVVGVALLFLYPIVMKYMIDINNTLVYIIQENKTVDDVFPKNTLPAVGTDSIEEIDFDENPFDGTGTDYMSQIANEANETKSLALSFVYLILTWQLITIVIHYYKRLLIIGFLIAVFPLVAMFYAVDKIADGKSQAFDHWNKEYMLNVFMQSFHAIVYIFVCGCVGATQDTTGFDYILIITGATFLFTGEEIVKKIFSQDSGVQNGAAKGLGATAAWSMAKVGAVTGVAAKVSKNLVGRESAVMKIRNATFQKGAAEAKLAVFDTFATNTEKPNSGMKLDSMEGVLEGINNDSAMSGSEKSAAKAEAIKVANAVADLNNPNTRSVSELQEAYEIVHNVMQTDPNNAILSDLKFTPDQMSGIDGLGREVATLVANRAGNVDPIQVEQHIKARLGYYMGEDLSESAKEKYTNMVLANMSLYGASRYDDPDGSAEREVNRSVAALSGAFSTFKYRENYDPENDEESSRKEEIRRLALEGIRNLQEDDEEATEEEKELAEGILILANRNLGIYTAEEYLEAAKKVSKNLEYDSSVARELAKTFNMDVDILQHGLARQAKKDGVESESVKATLREYETDVRDGYNDDEVSAHELIQLMYDDTKTDTEKESARKDVIDRVSEARRRSNAKEIQYTQDIADDILATKQVDLEAGRIDTQTKFLNGQTREDILKERRNAKISILKNLAGVKDTPTTGRYSDAYVENMKNHSGHRRGDGN